MNGEKMSLHLQHTMVETLGIKMFRDETGVFRATMPVDSRTCQLFGLLNGGASVALAENLAGYASLKLCDKDTIPEETTIWTTVATPMDINAPFKVRCFL